MPQRWSLGVSFASDRGNESTQGPKGCLCCSVFGWQKASLQPVLIILIQFIYIIIFTRILCRTCFNCIDFLLLHGVGHLERGHIYTGLWAISFQRPSVAAPLCSLSLRLVVVSALKTKTPTLRHRFNMNLSAVENNNNNNTRECRCYVCSLQNHFWAFIKY